MTTPARWLRFNVVGIAGFAIQMIALAVLARRMPLAIAVTTASVISDVVRLSVAAPPGRNSSTRPVTATAWPTAGLGADPRKTNRPSEVFGSLSGCGSWK